MESVSWMSVLTETKDQTPPPGSSPPAASAAGSSPRSQTTPPRSPHRQARSSGMFNCMRPSTEEDDEVPDAPRPVASPPRKLSRRGAGDDAGSGSDRSNESPARPGGPQRASVSAKALSQPSFFSDVPAAGDPPIWHAVESGDLHNFKSQLNAESARVTNKHKDTLLHQAVLRGRSEMIRMLLPASGLPLVPIDAQNLYGETPFHRACLSGNEALVQLLLERGANPNQPNVYGETPFYTATYNGFTSLVELLLCVRGIRWRESGEENLRPINLARNRNHPAVVRAILRHERWLVQRVLWIAHIKNPQSVFAALNATLLRRIIELAQPARDSLVV